MMAPQDLNLLAEFYATPALSDVSKDRVRRALSEAVTGKEVSQLIADIRSTLEYLLETPPSVESRAA